MAQKDRAQVAAAIDIGSSMLSMVIAQSGENEATELDYLEHPVNLGYETFTHGRVTFRTLEEMARVLEGFAVAARQYGVESDAMRITATTALREASNSAYVLDQLRVKTGIQVEVLEDGQEMATIFKEVLRRMERDGRDTAKPFMMAYIGTGSVGIAVVQDGNVAFARNVRVGSLKLSQMLGETGERTPRFHLILEEYLAALTGALRAQVEAFRPSRFIVCGKEIELIANLTHTERRDGMLGIARTGLSALYDEVKLLTPAQVSQKYRLRLEQAEVLLPSLAIYLTLTDFAHADILSPGVELSDWLLYERLYPKEARDWNRRFDDSIEASAWEMVRRYHADRNHAVAVENFALVIFDSLKKVHGFSRRERRLLQAAAILHDIGKFVNSKYHDLYSCHLIMDSNIIGLSTEEVNLVASIARYHSGTLPSLSHAEWAALNPDQRMTASKLAAILRMADALDRSHRQKVRAIELGERGNELVIYAAADLDITLEEWTFGFKSEFFTEVFGIRCVLRRKEGQ